MKAITKDMTSGKPLPLIISFAILLILPIFIGETGIFLAEVAALIAAAVNLVIYYYKEVSKITKLLESKEGPSDEFTI